jgi:putative secretion ATPase (PEP-CTERM system associated)
MYESFYHLTGKPFQLSPDPTFYYESKGHKRAYAYLEYGLYQGEGFIVITGEVGAGKTTVVRNLLAHLDPTRVVAAHLVSTQLDADDLLRAVCGAFGLSTKNTDKASLLAQLEKFLTSIAAERKRALLLVDEAQNLTQRAVEELRMLSNFQVAEHALLQSFLVGQPELRRTMQSPEMQQFRQRVIASYHLGPLDRQETEGYIEHRLKHVGWKADPQLKPDAYDAIYAFTAGIPRRVNLVCNRLMLAGFLGEIHVLSAEDVEVVVGEIKDELGIVSTDSLALQGEQQARNAGPPGSNVQAMTPQRAAEQSTSLSAPIEARLTRLENTLLAVLNALRRILHAVEASDKKTDRVAS